MQVNLTKINTFCSLANDGPPTGYLFPYPSKLTWEFTDAHPIRSIFPLCLVYSVPLHLLKWFYDGHAPPPVHVYYSLRVVMLLLSLVLEDWAVYELVPSQAVVVLVASSYATWTYQTHTFSNSLETLLVVWSLVLMGRIVEKKVSNITGKEICYFIWLTVTTLYTENIIPDQCRAGFDDSRGNV